MQGEEGENIEPQSAHGRIFFIVFSLVFSLFWAREGLEVGPQLGAKLEVVLGGVLERCWEVFGRLRWLQDGSRWLSVGP